MQGFGIFVIRRRSMREGRVQYTARRWRGECAASVFTKGVLGLAILPLIAVCAAASDADPTVKTPSNANAVADPVCDYNPALVSSGLSTVRRLEAFAKTPRVKQGQTGRRDEFESSSTYQHRINGEFSTIASNGYIVIAKDLSSANFSYNADSERTTIAGIFHRNTIYKSADGNLLNANIVSAASSIDSEWYAASNAFGARVDVIKLSGSNIDFVVDLADSEISGDNVLSQTVMSFSAPPLEAKSLKTRGKIIIILKTEDANVYYKYKAYPPEFDTRTDVSSYNYGITAKHICTIVADDKHAVAKYIVNP